jgi:hypothetical protein
MRLVYELHKSLLDDDQSLAILELSARLRNLNGCPVRLMVVQPGKYGTIDAVVITRTKPGLTWAWLAFDCLSEEQRKRLTLHPFTLPEAKQDAVLADLLRAHLGWKGKTSREPRPRGGVRSGRPDPSC